MKPASVYIGIDFGTSNCSVAYTFDDPRMAEGKIVDVQLVKFDRNDGNDSSPRLPTVLAENMHDKRKKTPLIGWDFFHRLFSGAGKAPLLRHGETFFRSVKSDLGAYRVYPRAFRPEYQTAEKVAGAILRHLLDETRRSLPGHDLSTARVVLTVPASLGAAAREETRKAALRAGLKPEQVEFLDEPVAALIDLLNKPRAAQLLRPDGSHLAIFDYGAGTLDISLVFARFAATEATGLSVENIAISRYCRLGGDAVDRRVMNEVLWPQIEAAEGVLRQSIPIAERKQIEDTLTATVARELKEKICRQVEQARKAGKTWDGIASAPLTCFAEKGTAFHGRRWPRFKMTTEQFGTVMQPFLSVPEAGDEPDPLSLVAPLMTLLKDAGLQPADLDWIILHGGSSKNPYVERLIRENLISSDGLFGTTKLDATPDRDTSVACGAAIACYWKHARKVDLVAAVSPEEIGIMTLGDHPVKLVGAGQTLPFPGQEGLYTVPTEFAVASHRQRTMLVPFYTGRRRTIAGTIAVKLPENVRQGDPVRLSLRIDRDKILHWWCSVAGGAAVRQDALPDPWNPTPTTRNHRLLFDHQRALHKAIESGDPISPEAEAIEASLLWQCGRHDELELHLADMMVSEAANSNPSLLNLQGLLCGEKGDTVGELDAHNRAVELAPNNSVQRGNLGYALLDAGRHSEGIAHIRAALGIDPSHLYLYERLGDLFRTQGDEAGALREYAEALRIAERASSARPEIAREWNTLARLNQKMGRYDQAREARGHAAGAQKDERYSGDHKLLIAGPDSGYLPPFPESE